jgi:ribosome-associated protein
VEEITIHTGTIQLDQFLKWAGVVDSGGQAKQMVIDKMVAVNGITVGERRKKLQNGDVVAVKGYGCWKVCGT